LFYTVPYVSSIGKYSQLPRVEQFEKADTTNDGKNNYFLI
jgi:hypothetical protein